MAGVDSFAGGSGFTINNPNWGTNKEKVSEHQIPTGIRSSLNDKILVATTSSNFAEAEPVLSPFVSVQQKIYDKQIDPNVSYLEVAFSPQNQINHDIVNQLGFFNIGDYIGDGREWKENTTSYKALDKLRDEYFTKYTKNYDLKDFVRLIRFFDNSLFKMIKDFTPSNTALTSGVVVKQHLLERNRIKPVQTEVKDLTYTSSIDVGDISAGAGGSFNRYQTRKDYFHITQSWSEIVQTLSGSVKKQYTQEEEFYNGIFPNPETNDLAQIDAISGFGGEDCSAFTNPNYEDTRVTPVFLSSNNFTEEEFLLITTKPARGVVWLWHDGTNVKHIKVASKSYGGADLTRELSQATEIPILLNNPSTTPFPNLTPQKSGFYSWVVLDRKIYNDYVYFSPNEPLSPTIVYSEDANIFDIDFSSTGDMIWHASASGTPANPFRLSGPGSSIPQGYFPSTPSYPTEQFFRGWDGATYLINYDEYINTDGTLNDQNGNFDTGNQEVSTAVTSSNQDIYGRYTGQSTLPWFMDGAQVTQSFNQATIIDLDPAATTRNIEVVSIILTPATSNCYTLNKDSVGVTVAVRYEGNEDLFVDNGSGRVVLAEGTNGFATVRDLEFYDVSQPNVVWSALALTTPASTTVTLGSGTYGVNKNSAENEDSILLQVGDIAGRQGIEVISYCP